MIRIVNPFAGFPVGADWAWHQSHGYHGGTDYKVAPGRNITAAAAGIARVVNDGLNSVEILLPDGRLITVREIASRVGAFPRQVQIGEVIGITGLVRGGITRWPHIDATVGGVRVPFEPLIFEPPVVAPLPPNYRVVSAAILKRRGAPNTAAVTGEPAKAGDRLNMTGWMRGEPVLGNDIWFTTGDGGWYWSGGFTDAGTHDLPELNPVSATQPATPSPPPAPMVVVPPAPPVELPVADPPAEPVPDPPVVVPAPPVVVSPPEPPVEVSPVVVPPVITGSSVEPTAPSPAVPVEPSTAPVDPIPVQRRSVPWTVIIATVVAAVAAILGTILK